MPFVGRAAELALVTTRFDEGARLVTLLGPGGMGKTALGVELALRRVALGARTSIVFCDLSAATDVAGVIDAMASACGLASEGIASTADGAAVQLGAALAARGEVLVVIDNLDTLAKDAASLVTSWLELAPEAEVLVTSRERVGMVEEVVVELGPLAEGVALLVAAAQKRAAGFVLRPEYAAIANEIALRLEGAPLALELAGSLLSLLGAQALLDHVRASAHALARDTSGGPARHTSLDAAVRGSVEALDGQQRDALAQLTVFRGGFTVSTAAAVLEVDLAAAARVVDELRARSLVRTQDAGAARFDLYFVVKSYMERMHHAPSAAAVERHAAYFVSGAEHAAADAHRDPAARAWLAAEHDNVLAVAARVLGAGPVDARTAEPALRGIVALSPMLLARGSFASVAALVAPVVERTRDSGADPRFAARATLLRGAIRRERGDTRGALKDLLGAESIARAVGDELLASDVRVELGRTVLAAGESAAAQQNFERAAGAFAALGAREREAHALAWLAVVTGDLRAARGLLDRAVALAAMQRAPGARYLLLLAHACADLGDVANARRAVDDAAAVAVADGDVLAEGRARVLSGLLHHDAGDLAAATAALAAARDSFEVHGLTRDAALARGHLGSLAREGGRAAEAYALLADARDVALRASNAGAPGELLDAWPARTAAGSLAGRIAARGAVAAEDRAALPDDALAIGEGGAWFRAPGGARVGLERRRSLALLLDCLAGETGAGSVTLDSAKLFATAWPGERAIASAAAHRVRVAVATLRKMGLRDAIVTTADGYALAANVRVIRA